MYIATAAAKYDSKSDSVTGRTRGSSGTSHIDEVASTGCRSRRARGQPYVSPQTSVRSRNRPCTWSERPTIAQNGR